MKMFKINDLAIIRFRYRITGTNCTIKEVRANSYVVLTDKGETVTVHKDSIKGR